MSTLQRFFLTVFYEERLMKKIKSFALLATIGAA